MRTDPNALGQQQRVKLDKQFESLVSIAALDVDGYAGKNIMNMIVVFLVLTSCFGSLAADTPAAKPTPQELARQIVTAFQSGRGAEIKPKLAVDIPILEKSAKTYPDDGHDNSKV